MYVLTSGKTSRTKYEDSDRTNGTFHVISPWGKVVSLRSLDPVTGILYETVRKQTFDRSYILTNSLETTTTRLIHLSG